MEHQADDVGECSGSHHQEKDHDTHLEPWPECDITDEYGNYTGDRQLHRLSRSQAQPQSPWRRDPDEDQEQALPRPNSRDQDDGLGNGEDDIVKRPRRRCYCSRSTISIIVFVLVVIIAAVVAGGVAGSQAWKT